MSRESRKESKRLYVGILYLEARLYRETVDLIAELY